MSNKKNVNHKKIIILVLCAAVAVVIGWIIFVPETPPEIEFRSVSELNTDQATLASYEEMINGYAQKDILTAEIHDENHIEINSYDFYLDTNEVTIEVSPMSIHKLKLQEGLDAVNLVSRSELIDIVKKQAGLGVRYTGRIINLGVTKQLETNSDFYALCSARDCSEGLLYSERETSTEEILSGDVSSGNYSEEVFDTLEHVAGGRWFKFTSSEGYRL